MNRDAKIGIVVVLIVVALLVIIWRRSDQTEDTGEPVTNTQALAVPFPTVDAAAMVRPATDRGAEPAVTPGSPPSVAPQEVVDTAAPVPPPPAPEPQYTIYTVKPNDALRNIARDQLGDEGRWKEIVKLNNIPDPDRLQIGQKLKLPPKAAAAPAAGGATAPELPGSVDPVVTSPREGPTVPIPAASGAATGGRKYVAKAGEGLMQIAREQLGDVGKWKKIAELNRLSEPYRVEAGQELVLPE